MKLLQNGWSKTLATCALALIATAAIAQNTSTQTILPGLGKDGANSIQISQPVVPPPGITVTIASTNQVSITITNGASYANYELYRRTALDSAHPWELRIVGVQGQTNFVAEIGPDTGFFEVAVGSDWDGDGVLNSMDGDPCNPQVAALQVWIDSPVQGSVLQ